MDLFGHPELNRPPSTRTEHARRSAVRRLAKMHTLYGHGPEGQTCRDCINLVRTKPHDTGYFKCRLYGFSRSEASDWRQKWAACGRFQQEGVR
jgi:hypothetical protein